MSYISEADEKIILRIETSVSWTRIDSCASITNHLFHGPFRTYWAQIKNATKCGLRFFAYIP